MMHGYGYNSAPFVWLHIHWLFWGLFIFGAIVALIWLAKYGEKKTLKQLTWISLVVGVIGGLLTAPIALIGMHQMWGGYGSFGSWMSDDWFDEDHYEIMEDHWEDMEEYWESFEEEFDQDSVSSDEDSGEEEDFRDDMEESMEDMMDIE